MPLMHAQDTRALHAVPAWGWLLLLAMLAAQVTWRLLQAPPAALAQELPAPPPVPAAQLASLGEPIALAGLFTLRLQAFDNQPGISIPFVALDYGRLAAWLDLILALDRHADYPLLLASHVYAQVPDPAKQQAMLEYTYRRYLQAPGSRWRFLAHAALIAKHRLHDLPLALRYAQALRAEAGNPEIPRWASQMAIFLLEDMNELQAARIELGALLASGSITDPQEQHFLRQRLQALEAKLTNSRP